MPIQPIDNLSIKHYSQGNFLDTRDSNKKELEALPDTLAKNGRQRALDMFEKGVVTTTVLSLFAIPVLSFLDEKEMDAIKSGKKVIDVSISNGIFKKATETTKSNIVNWELYRPILGTKYAKAATITFVISMAGLLVAMIHNKKTKQPNG